jgi:hypothetical protein
MVTDGKWDAELQAVLDNHVVDKPGDTSIGGNEFFRNVFRPYVETIAGSGHPHPFAAEDHGHSFAGTTGEPT